MLLFKPEHVPMILAQPPLKWQTRRIWKKVRVKVGSVHQARTRMLDKASTFAYLDIKRVWQERLRDISEDDARAEGYPDRGSYLLAFMRINRLSIIPEALRVWCVEFECVPADAAHRRAR